MDMDVVEAAQRRSRWRVALWLGLAFFGLLSLIPLGWGVVRWRTGREVAAEKERVRAAEEPVTLEEVVARIPPIPPEQDCTAILEEMLKLAWAEMLSEGDDPFASLELASDSIPPPGTDWKALAMAQERLVERQSYFEKLREITARNGDANLLRRVDQLDADLDEAPIFTASTIADLLELRVAVSLHRGEIGQTHESLEGLRSLSRLCTRHPMQIGLTTRLGIDANYRSAGSRVAECAQLDDTELAKLQATLREINYLPQLREAVFSERAYGAQAFDGKGPMFENPAGGFIEGEEDLEDYGMMDDRPVWWWTFTSHLDEWQYWRTMRRMCDATNAKDFQLVAREIRDAAEELHDVAGRSDFFTARYKVSLDTANSIQALTSYIATAVAMNRAVDAFLACERFRLAQGKYPETLDQLVPQYLPSVPIDPFDGKQLKYRRDGEEIIVYSVDSDTIDNQGRPPNRDGHIDLFNRSDIGFRSHDWKRSYEELLANPVSETERIGVDYDFGLDDDVD